MGTVLAVANQKGGVAKTTTVAALARAWLEAGRSVLAVDLDPQACLTWSLGIDGEGLARTVDDVLLRGTPLESVLIPADGVALAPANIDLAGAEIALLGRPGRERLLRRAVEPLRDRYDWIIVDCPPSLGTLTVNGLVAADEVVIPLLCDALGLRGVGRLLDTIAEVRAHANPALHVRGVIATMYDRRTTHGREVLQGVADEYGLPVLEPPVPKSVRVAEAPGLGVSLLEHAPSSKPARAYRELAAGLDAAARGSRSTAGKPERST